MLILPTPCFYDDLTRFDNIGGIPSVSIFVDISKNEAIDSINHWRKLLPLANFRLYVAKYSLDDANFFVREDGNASIVAVLPDNFAIGGISEQLVGAVFASCAPYDASGVYVKKVIEGGLISIIKKNRGFYLVHDPVNKIIRYYDHKGLRDRVHNRFWRKLFFVFVVRTIFLLVWVLARLNFYRLSRPKYLV